MIPLIDNPHQGVLLQDLKALELRGYVDGATILMQAITRSPNGPVVGGTPEPARADGFGIGLRNQGPEIIETCNHPLPNIERERVEELHTGGIAGVEHFTSPW